MLGVNEALSGIPVEGLSGANLGWICAGGLLNSTFSVSEC